MEWVDGRTAGLPEILGMEGQNASMWTVQRTASMTTRAGPFKRFRLVCFETEGNEAHVCRRLHAATRKATPPFWKQRLRCPIPSRGSVDFNHEWDCDHDVVRIL